MCVSDLFNSSLKVRRLLLTHNHPTSDVLVHMCNQVLGLLQLPTISALMSQTFRCVRVQDRAIERTDGCGGLSLRAYGCTSGTQTYAYSGRTLLGCRARMASSAATPGQKACTSSNTTVRLAAHPTTAS